jgi:hypothetical protein
MSAVRLFLLLAACLLWVAPALAAESVPADAPPPSEAATAEEPPPKAPTPESKPPTAPATLFLDLQLAQFDHTRAERRITLGVTGLMTFPALTVTTGALILGGHLAGLFGADVGIFVAGIVSVITTSAMTGVSVAVLIDGLVASQEAEARVHEIRQRMLDPSGAPTSLAPRPVVGPRLAFAW